MDVDQKRRLTRYFLNSDIFLWGLGNDINNGQEDVYLWLFREGFRHKTRNHHGIVISEAVYKGEYHNVKQEMVTEYGIEKIIDLVYRETIKQFGEENISRLKNIWERPGRLLGFDLSNIKSRIWEKKGKKSDQMRRVFAGCSFFDLDSRYWGSRWSKFAAIFFEEILPIYEKMSKNLKEE